MKMNLQKMKHKQKMKILLLNPPGKELYIRDYYCSKVSKVNYLYHPTDLLILSGILSTKHDVRVLDALTTRLSHEEAFKRVSKIDPDVLIFLTGSVSFKEDFPFIKKIKDLKKTLQVIGIGDIFMEDADKRLRDLDFLDAVLLNFTTDDILKYLDGKDPDKINNMVFKKDGKIINKPLVIKRGEAFSIPVPRYELFPNNAYSYPFIKNPPFATVLTDYGCPFRCSFCIMSHIGFRLREVDNVIEELKYIKSLGMNSVYFNDQTFGAVKERTIRLCEEMIKKNLDLKWVCFSRVDLIDDETISLMKRAGCHTIMFGVESGNQQILDRYNKGTTKDQIRSAFALCKKHGITTMATFILGLPGETKSKILETIKFAKEINSDYAAFNVPVPRMGTTLRKEAISSNLVGSSVDEMDQSGTYVAMQNEHLSRKEILKLKKKAYFQFYFRPSYIIKRLSDLKSFNDLKLHFSGIMIILKSVFKNPKNIFGFDKY